MKYILFIFLLSSICSAYHTPVAENGKPDHAMWSKELRKFVTPDGRVNYKSWVKDINGLNSYVFQLSGNPAEKDWSREEQLAYWINTYNAFTIKLILDHYPVTSIRDIDKGNPWDKKWIRLGIQTYSLNQIENEIIRPQFKDPRIHFALNCAAKSCPPLHHEAFLPQTLSEQLQTRTGTFLNNPRYNIYTADAFRISQIFDWYKSDFKPDVITFLMEHASCPGNKDVKIEYLPYDWSLNE